MAGIKGAVGFEADAERYELRYDINAICDLEDRLGIGISEISGLLNGGAKFSLIRTVFWAGLTGSRPGIDEREAGRIMSAVEGGMERVTALLAEAFAAAFDFEAADNGKGGSGKDSAARPPRKGKGGTG